MGRLCEAVVLNSYRAAAEINAVRVEAVVQNAYRVAAEKVAAQAKAQALETCAATTPQTEDVVQQPEVQASKRHTDEAQAEAVVTRAYAVAAARAAVSVKAVLRHAYSVAGELCAVNAQAVVTHAYEWASMQQAATAAAVAAAVSVAVEKKEECIRTAVVTTVEQACTTAATRLFEQASSAARLFVQDCVLEVASRVSQQLRLEASRAAKVSVQRALEVAELKAASRELADRADDECSQAPPAELLPPWKGPPEELAFDYEEEVSEHSDGPVVEVVHLPEDVDSESDLAGSIQGLTVSQPVEPWEDSFEGSSCPGSPRPSQQLQVHKPAHPRQQALGPHRAQRSRYLTPSTVPTRPEGIERSEILKALYGPDADAKLTKKPLADSKVPPSPQSSTAAAIPHKAVVPSSPQGTRPRHPASIESHAQAVDAGASVSSQQPAASSRQPRKEKLQQLRQNDQERLRLRFKENLEKTRAQESEKAYGRKLVREFQWVLRAAEVEKDCRKKELDWQLKAEARRQAVAERKEALSHQTEEQLNVQYGRIFPSPPLWERASSKSSSRSASSRRLTPRQSSAAMRDEAPTPDGFDRLDLFFNAYQEAVGRVIVSGDDSSQMLSGQSSTASPPRSLFASCEGSSSGLEQPQNPYGSGSGGLPSASNATRKVPWLRPQHACSIEAVVASVVSGQPLPSGRPTWVHLGPAAAAARARLNAGEVRSHTPRLDRGPPSVPRSPLADTPASEAL